MLKRLVSFVLACSLVLIPYSIAAYAGRPFPLPGKHSEIAKVATIGSADEVPGACGMNRDILFVRLEVDNVRYNYFYGVQSQNGLFVLLEKDVNDPTTLNAVYVWIFKGDGDEIQITRAVAREDLTPAEQETPCAVMYPEVA